MFLDISSDDLTREEPKLRDRQLEKQEIKYHSKEDEKSKNPREYLKDMWSFVYNVQVINSVVVFLRTHLDPAKTFNSILIASCRLIQNNRSVKM